MCLIALAQVYMAKLAEQAERYDEMVRLAVSVPTMRRTDSSPIYNVMRVQFGIHSAHGACLGSSARRGDVQTRVSLESSID